MSKVRVRFAPSPTGYLHLGGLRTAVYNYLFARKNKGDFILRIEDTDRSRYVEDSEKYIIDTINWLGIDYDEGVKKEKGGVSYRQSERLFIYKEYVSKLILEGKAYYAFETESELNQIRLDYQKKNKAFFYGAGNRQNLNNSLNMCKEEVIEKIKRENYVIRFKVPENIGKIIVNDLIRGEIEFDGSILDDKVLFKKDGFPTYHLANIVDDHLMDISHVIRGEEWLPSLPFHYLLYQSFSWDPPFFAHLPLILKPNGNGKLSKRDKNNLDIPIFPLSFREDEGDVLGLKDYGFLPEGVLNSLSLLGWNPGYQLEIFEKQQLIESFDLSRVQSSGAKFDIEKTLWINRQHIKRLSIEKMTEILESLIAKKGFSVEENKIKKISVELKERLSLLSDKEIWNNIDYLFERPEYQDNIDKIKKLIPDFTLFEDLVKSLSRKNINKIKEDIDDFIKGQKKQASFFMKMLRFSLVGDLKGFDILQIMCFLGEEEVFIRLEGFAAFLSKKHAV